MSTIVGTNIEVTNIKYDSDTTAMIVSSAGGGAGTVPAPLPALDTIIAVVSESYLIFVTSIFVPTIVLMLGLHELIH